MISLETYEEEVSARPGVLTRRVEENIERLDGWQRRVLGYTGDFYWDTIMPRQGMLVETRISKPLRLMHTRGNLTLELEGSFIGVYCKYPDGHYHLLGSPRFPLSRTTLDKMVTFDMIHVKSSPQRRRTCCLVGGAGPSETPGGVAPKIFYSRPLPWGF